MRVAILDYGSGNLHSALRALEHVGAEVVLTPDGSLALDADGLVVPGVGAFAACMDQLKAIGGDETIREAVAAAKPLLGICVGHQVLFSRGVEHGIDSSGVGIFPGTIERLPAQHLPHMGWNTLTWESADGPSSVESADRFYFVHSYGAMTRDDVPDDADVAWTSHDGARFIAAVRWRNLLSTQFHPEKSGNAGLTLLKGWVDSL